MNAERWTELKALFSEALALEGAARAEWLAELARRDAELHADLVALLTADAEPTLAVDGDIGLFLGLDEGGEAAGADHRVGTRIGPWAVRERVGEGGMGVVYRAERAEGEFDQQVALKVLRRGMDTEAILERFRNERRILAGLAHPNIARLVDGGMTDDGLPWFSMEYVEGESLTAYCDARRLSVEERIALFETVCDAVRYAQERFVVHRDLKPSNVLVTDEGEVKLLDFGIARMISDDATNVTTIVGGGRPLTLAYAAPEQLEGGTITTATDVYALGTILYELLTGVRPRELTDSGDPPRPSEQLTRTDPAELAARYEHSERLWRRLSGDLDNICLKALRDDPARRYATAAELLDDLGRWREGRPVSARPDTLGYRVNRFVSRNRAGVIGAALAVVALAVTAGGYTVRLAQERNAAETAAAEAQEVTDFLVELFQISDPTESLGRSITAREVLSTGRERIDQELQDQPEVRATLLGTMGRVYTNLGLHDDARPLLTEALALREAASPQGGPRVAESLRDLATLDRQVDRFASADSLQRRAMGITVRLEGEESEGALADLAAVGQIQYAAGDFDAAEATLRQALEAQRALHEGDHESVALATQALAAVAFSVGQYDTAAVYSREALDMRRRLHDPMHPEVIRAYEGWGNALANTGRAPQAEEVAREIVEMKEQLYGADHPTVARSLHFLGSTIQFQDRYAEAIEVFEEALRRFEASVGLEHSAAAAVYGNLARSHRLLGDPERAIEFIERGVELYEAIYGRESYRMRQHLSILGNSYAEAGRLRDAMAIYDRIEAINVAHDVYDRTNYSNKALTWRDLGDEEAMMAEYAAAVAQARENFPDDPLVAVQALISMGLAHGELGEWDAAADTLRTVYEIRRAELPEESWYVWNSLSLYGYALLGTDRIDEAGPALLKAYEGLVAAPRDRSADVIDLRIRDTIERLTWFYEETGNAEELARWQEVLRELDAG